MLQISYSPRHGFLALRLTIKGVSVTYADMQEQLVLQQEQAAFFVDKLCHTPLQWPDRVHGCPITHVMTPENRPMSRMWCSDAGRIEAQPAHHTIWCTSRLCTAKTLPVASTGAHIRKHAILYVVKNETRPPAARRGSGRWDEHTRGFEPGTCHRRAYIVTRHGL